MEKIWKKNEEVRLRIEDLSREGDGIGHVDGYTLFVKNTVPGDCGTVRIIKAKKNYGYGIMTEIQEPSSWRTEPVCPVARPCGGCQMQHILYEKQLEWKRRKVQDCLERIGGLTGITVNPVIGMENPWHYRNKAQFPVGCDKEGKLTAGFYAMRSHSIISQEHCYIQDACNDEILKLVLEYMEENRVSAYEEQTGKGLVRHVITRIGKATGEIMAALVINGEEIPCPDRLIERLRRVKGMTSICLNINRANTNVILGDRVKMLWGREYITDRIGDVRYRISLLSFYQVNTEQTRKLYETALEFAALTGT